MKEYEVGYFRGRKTIQRSASVGGARSVFVKLQGNKNELVYPTFGGFIKNPFKGAGKVFAGDLIEYRTDSNGVNPEVYILKTYLVHSVSGKTLHLVRDGYKHTPFVGDKIGLAPSIIGGAMTCATIDAVATANVGGVDVWTCTTSVALTVKKDDVLVEGDAENKMLVKKINAVAPTDLDMFDAPATGADDFENARYSYTPALGGLMYISKMSPIPPCVLATNTCNVSGWFKVDALNVTSGSDVAALDARVKALESA